MKKLRSIATVLSCALVSGCASTAPAFKPAVLTEAQRAAAAAKAGIEWVAIPGGTFMMGASDLGQFSQWSQPVHQVKVPAFQLAKSEVTRAQYQVCVDAGACPPVRCEFGDAYAVEGFEDYPVVCVSWDDARRYCAFVGGRLPSESEWEYAARSAGKVRRYPWGTQEFSCELAATEECGNALAPVCEKPAGNTEQGLCDMAGNAGEWVEDAMHDSYQGAPADGSAWVSGNKFKVWRGGDGKSPVKDARSEARSLFAREVRFIPYIGFRPAR